MTPEAITEEFFRQQATVLERGKVKRYFDRRPPFCVNMCPNYYCMSDTCAVVEGDMEPHRCPDLHNAKERT